MVVLLEFPAKTQLACNPENYLTLGIFLHIMYYSLNSNFLEHP